VSESRLLDRPVRVLHVLYSLRMGGTELGVVKLVNALPPSDVVSAVASCKPADSLKDRLAPGVKLFEFHRRDGNDPRFVAQLVRLFRREKPDVVHTHSWGTLVEGIVAARLARVPHVIHGEHGTMEERPRNLRVQRWLWPRADRLLSVSSRLAERMADRVGFERSRIQVIRNGIDTVRFSPAPRDKARAAFGFGEADVVIGTAGRLVPVKDQATLIAALGVLKARGVDFTCVIAGDGPLRTALLEQIESAGLSESIRLLGGRADIDQVLAALDIFVLSSVSEGMSNTILEAMATGLPVVATRVGGADELVEDGMSGLLVPSQDPARMADALAGLVADRQKRTAMGASGRERALSIFPFDGMIAAYRDLYLELTGARRPGGSRASERICAA
jgi:sugar transferase (PEP-CTERM/EpsH1 system associated)